MSPTQAGRYKIVEELGRGAMGIVYRGYDPTIGRTVAIKTVLLDTGDPETIKRFRREAQAAGILSHPNIVTIFDAGEDEGMFYIAMEMVEGATLQQMLARGSLSVQEAISVVEQVSAALDHAHQHLIVHRDIKPANIMVTHGHVKVMDFGVAKIKSVGMTSTGQVLGTPSYMSPELVKGENVDGRSDIFSLGVMLYEMLTGARPFVGENVTTVIYKIIGEEPEAPGTVNPQLNPGLNYVVLKALAKDPAERYQTCAQLVADLKNHAALAEEGRLMSKTSGTPGSPSAAASATGRTVAVRPSSGTLRMGTVPRVPDWLGRREVLLGAATAGLLAAGLGIIWWVSRTSGPSSGKPEAIVVSAPQPANPAADKSDGKSEGQPTPAATKSAGGTAAASATVANVGRVAIHTAPPNAIILVNGKPTAYRSPVNFALPPGRYRIGVEKPGFERETWNAVVRKDKPVQFQLVMRPTATRRVGPLFR